MSKQQGRCLFKHPTPPAATFTVQEEIQLLPFLLAQMPQTSRTRIKAILTGGGITVNNMAQTRHNYLLRPGDTVEVSSKKQTVTLQSRFLRLVWEDDHLIVIDKAPGVLSMPTPHHLFSVKSILDNYLERKHARCHSHVVHRLDRDTSGLMVYAKTHEAEQILEAHWHEMVTDRRYVALCEGRLPQEEGEIESWLTEGKAFFTHSCPYDNGGKWALTRYRMLEGSDRLSLVELRLATGRKNQIRIHLQSIGCPVCGDPKYGSNTNPIGRLALHAFRLHFTHPITGEPLRFDTPIPQTFTAALRPPLPPRR